ncbi:hypothetical protein J6P92_02595 [bacterium]|nr:hypothetical protein [bacterium]
MKCLKPIKIGNALFACGKCEACCANKANDYIIRFRATARHMARYFITLTYEDNCLPFNGLLKDDLQFFIRDLKKKLKKMKIDMKYVAIGEYGGAFCRPHYHINLFTSEKIQNINTLLESLWSLGIVNIKDLNNSYNDVRALEYIAKYHATSCLSRGIYRIKGYPLFFRQEDEESKKECIVRLSGRFALDVKCLDMFEFIQCAEPFRLTSRGVGEELFHEKSFQRHLENGSFFTTNNNKRLSRLPRYYVDHLSLKDKVRCNLAKLDFAKNREINKVDLLAIEWQNMESAQKYMANKWKENYEENVIKAKKKRQRNL